MIFLTNLMGDHWRFWGVRIIAPLHRKTRKTNQIQEKKQEPPPQKKNKKKNKKNKEKHLQPATSDQPSFNICWGYILY